MEVRERGATIDVDGEPHAQMAAYLDAQGVNGSVGDRMLERLDLYLDRAKVPA